MPRRDRRAFVIAFLLSLGLVLAPFGALTLRLAALGEIFATSDAGVRLRGTLFSDFLQYKLAEASRRRPEVIVVGASRVMEFRGGFFQRCAAPSCFYNAGGGMPDLRTTLAFLRALPQDGSPRVLLLGIDPFNLNPAYAGARHGPLTLSIASNPFRLLDEGLARVRAFPEFLIRERDLRAFVLSSATAPAGTQGVRAILRDEGFRLDGSYQYPVERVAREMGLSSAERAVEALRNARAGCCLFEPFETVDEQSVHEIEQILEVARARGTRVVAFTPPVAEEVADIVRASPALRVGWAAARTRLSTLFAARDVPFFGPLALADAGCGPGEHFDGLHVTEVCDARILARLARIAGPDHALASYVDADSLDRLVASRDSDALIRTGR